MYRFRFLSLILLVAAVKGSPPLQLEDQRGLPLSESANNVISTLNTIRLPSSITPSNYKLQIVPILDTSLGPERQFTAPGKVAITVACTKITKVITLHAKEIDFDLSKVTVGFKFNSIGGQGHMEILCTGHHRRGDQTRSR